MVWLARGLCPSPGWSPGDQGGPHRLAVARMGTENGLKTELDLLQAEQQWRAGQRDFRKGRYDQVVAYVKPGAAAGMLTAGDVVALDALFVRVPRKPSRRRYAGGTGFATMTETDDLPPMPCSDGKVPADPFAWAAFRLGHHSGGPLGPGWPQVLTYRGARAAAVLIEHLDDHTYVPMAVVKAQTNMARLAGVVGRPPRTSGVVRPAPEQSAALHIAYPLMADAHIAGVVALEILGAEADADCALR